MLDVVAPLIFDVRTPSEYAQAHIPSAINLPLFSDEERTIVGTIYVQQSHDEAVKKGLDFVGPRLGEIIRQVDQVLSQKGLFKDKVTIRLYCARGGMRSQSVGWLLRLSGYRAEIMEGGFKAYKRRLSEYVDRGLPLIVLAGPTGSGKTDLLDKLKKRGHQILDLEALARHRGSAFGYLPDTIQPTNEMLHCLITDELERMDFSRPIFTESESLKIGCISLPETFFRALGKSDYIGVELPKEVRASRIIKLYSSLEDSVLEEGFQKISKRIGGDNYHKALEALRGTDYTTATNIALDYYDKAYSRSVSQIYTGRRLGFVTCDSDDLDQIADQIEALLI